MSELIIDSTKLGAFMDCPRRYMFEHGALSWRPDSPSIHLEFGVAWHKAMEHMFLHKCQESAIPEALNAFLSHYRQHFDASYDVETAPKNPANALNALISFAKTYGDIYRNYDVLYTEIAGTVPLHREIPVTYKIDAVIRDEKGIWNLDFKTGSRLDSWWGEQWHVSHQMNIYQYALATLDIGEVAGTIVHGTLFYKTDVKHVRQVVYYNEEALIGEIHDINAWIDSLSEEHAKLDAMPEEERTGFTLDAFPRNRKSCFKYGKCPYFDLCGYMNPLKVFEPEDPEPGFVHYIWNPLDEVHNAKHVAIGAEVTSK